MRTVAALCLLILGSCSLHEKPKWALTISDGVALGDLRPVHTENIDRAVATYRAFLSELDSQYFSEVNLDNITLHAMHSALTRLNPHGEIIRLKDPLSCTSDTGIGAIFVRDYDNNIVISSLAYTSPVIEAGLRAGDKILSIDGKSTNMLTASEAAELVICNGRTSVVVTAEHDGIVVTKNIPKRVNSFPTMISTRISRNIQYLWVTDFASLSKASHAIEKLEHVRGNPNIDIIIDLRSITGGFVSAGKLFLSMFVPAESIALWYGETPLLVPDIRTPLSNRIVVLTNRRTASLGEVIALALKDLGRAVVIGETTMGFGTALGETDLPDRITAYIPHVIYYGPNKTAIEGTGLHPTIEVTDTNPYGYYVPNIPDAILEKAIAYLAAERLQYAKVP